MTTDTSISSYEKQIQSSILDSYFKEQRIELEKEVQQLMPISVTDWDEASSRVSSGNSETREEFLPNGT